MSTVLGVVGDIHARWDFLDRVLDVFASGPRLDGILLVGDLATCSGRNPRQREARRISYLLEVQQVLRRVGELGVDVFYVPGNHDHPDLGYSGNIDGRTARVGDLTIGGIGGAGPDRMGFSYEWSEDEIRSRAPLDVDVLVSHCPPLSSPFDRIPRGDHVGSQAVRERVESVRGVAVFGHIHESFGVGQIADCLCMNLGGMGPPAAHPRAGWIYGTDAVVLRDVTTGKDQCAERPTGATVSLDGRHE